MGDTKIQWTDKVWNPTVGCTKVSAGCKNCYAERIYERFHPGQKFTDVHMIPGRLVQPLHWRKPCRIFVDSMSDLFHADVPDASIAQVFAVMAIARWHTFQILTKRPERMPNLFYNLDKEVEAWQEQICAEHGWCPQDFDWPLPNVWLGVSVENQQTADERIPLLLETPAAVRFVSCEPLLGSVDLYAHLHHIDEGLGYDYNPGIHWVIAGGESGPGARCPRPEWFTSLRNQCKDANIPFFFKQWGGPFHLGWVIEDGYYHDDWLEGRQYHEFPEHPHQ